jgi:L-fucose isomerase-like protein
MSVRNLKPLKVLPVLVCRKGQVRDDFMKEKLRILMKNVKSDVQILKHVTINEEKDVSLLEKQQARAEAIVLYRPHLGLGDCIVKVSELSLPTIIFNDEGLICNPLDALEYIQPKENVWVAIDYRDLNSYLTALSAKKKLGQTKILILNADYPHWERFLCRIRGGQEAIKKKLGIELEYVRSDDVIERWKNVDERRARQLAKKWIREAENIIGPEEKDVISAARLYMAMKDLLKEKKAQALTMAYGDNPLPVPCVAYTNLRDEGIPAACEADINSLLSMTIMHYLADKPSFMGNTFIDPADKNLIISHCVCPRKMQGYNTRPTPYMLRPYHTEKFTGSLTAFVKMKRGQEITLWRLSGDLQKMLVTKGTIVESEEYGGETYCRVKTKVKINNPRELVHRTSGNHHVLVYGDYTEQLRRLNEILGITTIEV